jgi:DNA transformation protein
MAVRDSYREYVLEQLGRVRLVTWRKMFGGVGVYADDRFFALLDNDTLYFKTGDANRADFEARGMPPFQPFGPGTKPMDYHELPGDVLEDPAELAAWLAKAVTVAAAGAKPKRPARKNPSRPPKPRKVKGDGP